MINFWYAYLLRVPFVVIAIYMYVCICGYMVYLFYSPSSCVLRVSYVATCVVNTMVLGQIVIMQNMPLCVTRGCESDGD